MSTTLIPESPYRGLNAFEDSELDALLFFGRERETEIVVANLIASRLTVLYGPSGVGKSSLLGAAVARTLRELPENPLVVVFSSWSDDPSAGLSEAVAASAGTSANGSALATVERAQSDRDVYLVFDQAEEYFLYHADDRGEGSFAEALPAILSSPSRVNVLVSLREDSLAKLDRFTGRVPGLFANTLRLDRLNRQAARAAIVGPVERYAELTGVRITLEPELVEHVLDEVGAGQIEPALGGRGAIEGTDDTSRIEAPYLQLVMQRLWEEERAAGSDELRVVTFGRLGGAQRIVEEHFESAMDALSAGQKDVAARLFDHLVTPSGTKIAHELSDLADFGRVPIDALLPVLAILANRRILRSLDAGGDVRYEIFHDVLAEPVLAWRTSYEAERELALQKAASDRRHRFLLAVIVAGAVLLAVMGAVTLYALTQRTEARNQARDAKASALAAGALAALTVDPQLSVLLASEAVGLAPSAELEDVLRRSLEASKLRLVLDGDGPVNTAAFSPDDTRLVTASEDGRVRVFDAGNGAQEVELAHDGPVSEAWFSPDADTVLSASEDGTARLWDADTGSERQVLEHAAAVSTARFSLDGRRLITAGVDRSARVWAAADGRSLLVLRHAGPVLSAVFSPDGRRIATVSERRDTRVTARVFDGRTGRQLYALDQVGVTSALFSPDSRLLVTTSSDRTARIWRAADGKLRHVLDQPDGHVVGAAFSPDGTQLVTASDGGTARVWDVATGGRLLVLVGPTNPVTDASFSPDGAFVVVSSLDRTARLYRADNGLQVAILVGHDDGVTRATFSSDGRHVVTASVDATARVWEPGTADALQLVGRHRGSVRATALRDDGLLAVSGDNRGSVRVWDVDASKPVHVIELGGTVSAVEFSPGGRSFIASGISRPVTLWDVESGKTVRTFDHHGALSRLVFSGDGAKLLTAGSSGARVWDTESGELVADLTSEPVTAADMNADGTRVVTAGPDGAYVWSVETGERLQELQGHDGLIGIALLDPLGRRVLMAGEDDVGRLWDAETGDLMHELVGHGDDVLDAAFGRNGSLVATASQDGDGAIWDVETGAQLHVLRGHFNPVYSIAFDSSGRWILTGSQRTAALWPTSSGLLQQYLRGHELPVVSVEFAATSWRALTASEDGTVRTWTCETCGEIPELLALASERLERAGRELTPDERERYLD